MVMQAHPSKVKCSCLGNESRACTHIGNTKDLVVALLKSAKHLPGPFVREGWLSTLSNVRP